MSIVITNGSYYIHINENGGLEKTSDFEEATIYDAVRFAVLEMKCAPVKTSGYYVYDTITGHICWKWLTDEEKMQRVQKSKEKKCKIKRKHYSQSTRKMIYNAADGRCQLCGRKILYDEMTLDHIVPLAMNGADEVENLQCACRVCNAQKDAYLPDEFFERITDIFMFQMEKKWKSGLKWNIAKGLLKTLI